MTQRHEFKIVEVEVGSHFLTFYVDPKPQGLHEKVYKSFCRIHPEYASIQQKNFTHEAGDVPIYHPTGCPRDDLKKDHWRHFHIRSMVKPDHVFLTKCLDVIKRHADISDFKVSHLEVDNYPTLPVNEEEYLKTIDLLRGTK